MSTPVATSATEVMSARTSVRLIKREAPHPPGTVRRTPSANTLKPLRKYYPYRPVPATRSGHRNRSRDRAWSTEDKYGDPAELRLNCGWRITFAQVYGGGHPAWTGARG